ncbi:MAG: hypothetical protein OXG15_09620 [Gammaproteobacteria bacterium]|nr:hypothetical protein [Gammaproteobacteria bacterium]
MTTAQRIIESPWRGVIYAAGGSMLISDVATRPGASRALLAGNVPYHNQAMNDLLGCEPESYCSILTSRQLAMRAFMRARQLAPTSDHQFVFGVGITAALRSDKPKRGDHRAYVALQTMYKTLVWHVRFEKGELTRLEEERKLTDCALNFLDYGLELDATSAESSPTIEARCDEGVSQLLDETPTVHGDPGEAVLPGAFNPLHDGHRRMRELAEERLNQRVVFELSVRNVDKPDLDFIDINERIEQFDAAEYVLTNQPTFIEKARLLFNATGGTFVVGTDTLSRIDHARYYTSRQHRDEAIAELSNIGIRFLVFGRLEGSKFLTLDDLELGSDLLRLCDGVTASDFRADVSSTELRKQDGT